MKTKPDKIIDVFKMILVYSYGTSKSNDEIMMNQDSFAEYLNISKRSVLRHFSLAKELGLIKVIGKHQIYSGHTKSKWCANIYDVDQTGLNQYILDKTGYNVLENIDKEIHNYYKYMTFLKDIKKNNMLNEMTNEEKLEFEHKIVKKEERKAKKLKKLYKENKYYVDLLQEVNNTSIPLHYLEDNKKRLVNVLCATRNPENSDSSSRTYILSKYFGSTDIIEIDTNASIYRLSYALGNKKCADSKIDMYKLIFDACNFNLEWTKEFRYNFKYILMPIYMRESSIKFRSLTYESKKDWKWFSSKSEEKELKFYKYLEQELDMPIYDILVIIKDAMHKIFNLDKFYRADIFIYESNLHILMLKIFKDMRIKTINVYDGFYFIRGTMTPELYNKVYEQATNQLLKNYNII